MDQGSSATRTSRGVGHGPPKIEQWSGKKKQADEHFPGAFSYTT
jgi:hypothetical protein